MPRTSTDRFSCLAVRGATATRTPVAWRRREVAERGRGRVAASPRRVGQFRRRACFVDAEDYREACEANEDHEDREDREDREAALSTGRMSVIRSSLKRH